MRWKSFVVAWALALTLLLFAQRHSAKSERLLYANVVDLSHSVSDAVNQNSALARSTSSPSSSIAFDQPATTRLDAPSQLIKGMWSVDQIPSERLVRPMVVIDIHNKVRANSDYRLSMQDVADWEQLHGHIPGGAVVMAATGWDDRWTNLDLYRNLSSDGTPHFPGYTLEAVRFLVEARGIVGIGIDSPSTDGGNSTNFSVHRYCAEHSVYHLANVANIARVPESGAVAVVTPLKLEKGTGAPVRLLALLK
jgi:kynurenine formamidase